MPEVERDEWYVIEVVKGKGRWIATGYIAMNQGTVLKFETAGRDPFEAQAYLEQCIVQELMPKERVGAGRRAYDGYALDPITYELFDRRRRVKI